MAEVGSVAWGLQVMQWLPKDQLNWINSLPGDQKYRWVVAARNIPQNGIGDFVKFVQYNQFVTTAAQQQQGGGFQNWVNTNVAGPAAEAGVGSVANGLIVLSKIPPDQLNWIKSLPGDLQYRWVVAARNINPVTGINDFTRFLQYNQYIYTVAQQGGGAAPAPPADPGGGLPYPPDISGGGGGGGPVVTTVGPVAGGGGGGAPASAPTPVGMMDGTVYEYAGQRMVLFQPVPGVRVRYWQTPNAPLPAGQAVSPQEWFMLVSASVDGGNSEELVSIQRDWGSFGGFWNNILDRVFTKQDPARNDPGVLQVIAKLAARPDMGEAELQNLLQSTDYWRQKTDRQREWNDLSPAEQDYRIKEEATALAEQWFTLVGAEVAYDNEFMDLWARQVASGERSRAAVIETEMKTRAKWNPESPYSRTLRAETENQRRRGFDIEQKQADIRTLSRRWGVQLSEPTIKDGATRVVSLQSSDDDLIEYLKDQAQILFPWKDRDIETETAAQPWIQTFERVLEQNGDLFNPKIQQALQQGLSAFDFEKSLKSSPDWEQTKNFQEAATNTLGEVARRMGFAA